MRKHSNPKCKTCKYRAFSGAVNGCDYIVVMERSRGCSVEECDKYEKGNRNYHGESWRTKRR